MSQQPLDLTKSQTLPDGHNYSLKIEKDETQEERRVRLFKDVVLFLAAVGLVGTFTYVCMKIALDPRASADAQKFAFAFLAGLGSGLVGYLLKK